MSLTNTKQCIGVGNDTLSRKGYRDTQHGNRNGDRGNNRFANSSPAGETIDNRPITKDGPRSIQLTKIIETIPLLCQYHHYDYISDIFSTNIEPTQE